MNTGEALCRYGGYLEERGLSSRTRKEHLKRVEDFLDARPEAVGAGPSELRRICEGYIESLPLDYTAYVIAAAVRHYWSMVAGTPFFKHVWIRDFERDEAIEREGREFGAYIKAACSIQEDTAHGRVRDVKKFLYAMFPAGSFDRAKVDAETVRTYVSESLAHTAPASRGRFCTDVRCYARFLVSEGHVAAASIAKLPLKVRAEKGAPPPALPDEDYRAILEAADERTARGARDKAMAMCMGNLGLRASDVARLTLDDVEWDRAILHVRQSKSISERSIPIDAETGAAIELYVTAGRDNGSTSRSLFLPEGREDGSKGGLKPARVADAVRELARKAGVRGFRGSHSLRRAAATNMVGNGASIKVVADVLGHESVTTTMGYLRLDVEWLRPACAPWPKGGSL